MIRRAASRSRFGTDRLILASSLLTAIVLIGCGGGGGGGDNGGGGGDLGACGSPAGSTTPVVCGRVVSSDAQRTPVEGATVTIRDINGQVVSTTATNAQGLFRFTNVPQNAVLFRVDPPSPAFHQNIAQFRGNLYGFNNTAQAGGPCLPDIIAGAAPAPPRDTQLPDVLVFSAASPPPPPFGCPR